MKRSILFMSLAVCWLWATSSVPAQVAKQDIWPAPSPVQKYWFLPKADLSAEQIAAVFEDAAAARTAFKDPHYANALCKAKKIQLKLGKGAKASDDDGIRIYYDWSGTSAASRLHGSSKCFWKLADVRQIELAYHSAATDEKWMVVFAVGQSPWFFWFRDEAAARALGDAVASALVLKGLGLDFPKFGMTVADLTPRQAQDLGMTRIENALATAVTIDSPADRAGVRTLDIITELNGIRIRNASHFLALSAQLPAHAKAVLSCLRRVKKEEEGGERTALEAVIFEVPLF